MEYNEGESPIDFLQDAALCYATAIKNKPKDANLHQLLGQVLEEKYYAEDLFGLKKEVCVFPNIITSSFSDVGPCKHPNPDLEFHLVHYK